MLGVPSIGVTNAGVTTLTAFNVNMPSLATQVGPTTIAAGPVTERHFLTFQFSTEVSASSVSDGTFSGSEGIVIQDAAGNNVRYVMDSMGVIDPTNTFSGPGVAPALLRLYIQDAVLFGPLAPNRLVTGTYVVNVLTQNLRGSMGQSFCLAGSTTSNCANNVEVSYALSVGMDMTAIGAATNPAGGSIPLTGSMLARNGEVRLFFNDNVDLQSIIGRTGAGPNTTTRDQFISAAYPMNNLGPMGMGTSMGENLLVTYTAPGTAVIPINYGFVVYMPDPFHNPREVRLRFVDRTMLQPSDLVPNTQNYGLDAVVYTGAGFPAPTNTAGSTFMLPPILPLPGSNTMGMALLRVTLMGNMSAIGPSDTSNNGDGRLGVTDRSRNALTTDIVINLTVQSGPPIANNPSPPDMHVVVNGNQLSVVSGGTVTMTARPVAAGDTVIGTLNPIPTPLNDPNTLGQVLDIEFGRFLNLAGANIVHNAPRRFNPMLPVTDNNGDESVPVPQGGTPQTGLLDYIDNGLIDQSFPPPMQPLGVRLYVVDGSSNQVKVFDSTTFILLTTLTGVPSPSGLGIAPNLSFLYISNLDQGTVTRVGSNPLQTTTFHLPINTITVGANPRGITVTPNNEDLIVINSGSNSVSFVDVATQTQRIELSVGLGPRDVFATNRMLCMGCTLAYEAYVTNFFTNSVSVYESDSVSVMVNNGLNGKIFTEVSGFQGPSGGCWNRFSTPSLTPNVLIQGAYIANTTGTTIQHLALVNFGLSPPPGFPGVPEFRTFQIVNSYSTNTLTGAPGDVTIENLSGLSVPPLVGDNKVGASADLGGGSGVPSVLMVSYPAAGRVAAYDLPTGALFGSVATPGSAIYSYYDQ